MLAAGEQVIMQTTLIKDMDPDQLREFLWTLAVKEHISLKK